MVVAVVVFCYILMQTKSVTAPATLLLTGAEMGRKKVIKSITHIMMAIRVKNMCNWRPMNIYLDGDQQHSLPMSRRN